MIMRCVCGQLLEELCHKNNWPMPHYQLHTAVHHDIINNTATDVQLFIFKVYSHLSCRQLHLSGRLYRVVQKVIPQF